MKQAPGLSESPERLGRTAKSFSTTITALKSATDRGRAELIRDVVDAFRRLYGSVLRFVQMFADGQGSFLAAGKSGSGWTRSAWPARACRW